MNADLRRWGRGMDNGQWIVNEEKGGNRCWRIGVLVVAEQVLVCDWAGVIK
jgi:hypothetical protein